jgi:Uma2 family endonuclease
MATIASRLPIEPRRTPPLQNGDHLTREEFERRFDATPNLKKAELIEGVVYMPPPVSHEFHSVPHSDLNWFLTTYRIGTPEVWSGDNGSLRLDLENMPQPDTYLLIDPKSGGQARIDSEGYVEGGPELIGEVAASSASYDLHQKLRMYLRHQVREYLVWRVYDRAIDWFVLAKGKFNRLSPDSGGVFRSRVFPGLWLDAPALLRRDYTTLSKVLRRGMKSKEHAEFVKKLRTAGQSK